MKIATALIGALSAIGLSQTSDAATAESGGSLTIVNPAGLFDPSPFGFSHVVVASGGKRVAHISGQTGGDPKGVISPDFETQVRQSYANLRTALTGVGAKPDRVAKITTFVVNYDESMLATLTKHIKETFGPALPAWNLVPVPRLALKGMLFEVDAVAILE